MDDFVRVWLCVSEVPASCQHLCYREFPAPTPMWAIWAHDLRKHILGNSCPMVTNEGALNTSSMSLISPCPRLWQKCSFSPRNAGQHGVSIPLKSQGQGREGRRREGPARSVPEGSGREEDRNPAQRSPWPQPSTFSALFLGPSFLGSTIVVLTNARSYERTPG